MGKKSLVTHFEDICRREGVEYTRVLMPRSASEHDHQVAIFDEIWRLAVHDPRYEWAHAVPNGAKLPWMRGKRGKRFSPQAMKLKAEGLTPGVSDIFVPWPEGGYHGLYIELKRERKASGAAENKPTREQVKFLKAMRKRGFAGLVCYGAQEALCAIALYMKGLYDEDSDEYRIQTE